MDKQDNMNPCLICDDPYSSFWKEQNSVLKVHDPTVPSNDATRIEATNSATVACPTGATRQAPSSVEQTLALTYVTVIVGLCFKEQMVNNLPIDSNDVKMNHVLFV